MRSTRRLFRRIQSFASLSVGTLLVAVTAACGDSSSATDTGPAIDSGPTADAGQPPDAGGPPPDGGTTDGAAFPFTADQAWGPVGTEPPVGAETVTADEFVALSAGDGFELLDSASLAAAVDGERQRDEEARVLVEQAMGQDPRYARWFPPASAPLPPDLVRRASGGYEWHTSSGEILILDGEETKMRSVAFSLRETEARPNLEARYQALFDALPEDARAELPAPDALTGLTDTELKGHLEALQARLSSAVPRQVFVDSGVDPGGLGCTEDPPTVAATLSRRRDNPGWQLRAYETSIRHQGLRGSCTAHAITAGLEAVVKRKHGVTADFSEQELYANAKGSWFPAPLDFKDGLPVEEVAEEMINRAFHLDAEARWPYNMSMMRLEDNLLNRYTHSCDAYAGYCSDTNHQQKRVCTTVGPNVFCGYVRPPAVDTTAVGNVRLRGMVSLWNPLEPQSSIAAIRAHLDAGHPVVIGANVGPTFRYGTKEDTSGRRGFVLGSETGGIGPDPDERGGHALLVVGYIPNSLLPEDLRLYVPWYGTGVLVAKNSWGCGAGDQGHSYLSYAWLEEAVHSAVALTNIATSITAPEVKLSADRSSLTSPGSVRFTMTTNRATVKVELYDGLSATAPLFTRDIAGPADNTVSTSLQAFAASNNGVHLFVAHAIDVFGNLVASSIVGVFVNIDNVDPTVTLSADRTTIVPPRTITLRAAATDAGGIARVQFLEGLSVIGQDTTPPYELPVALGTSQVGVHNFVAIAHDTNGNQRASNIISVTVLPRLSRPVINQFDATPAQLPAAGGSVDLSWQTSGAAGVTIQPTVGRVSADGAATVQLDETTTFTLTATNAFGSTSRQVTVVVSADTTPPTVSLSPSSTFLTAPDTLTLTANAQDDVRVAEVEFYRDGVSFAVDATPGDGFQAALLLTGADAGVHGFHAVARDAAGNQTASSVVSVTVSSGTDVFVSPAGTDGGNTTCLEPTPCQTIAYAATRAPAGSAVVLLDGTYDTTTQGTTAITIPDGVGVRARHDRMAIVKCVLSFAGSGSVIGVRIDRTAPNVQSGAGIRASAGAVLVESVDWVGSYNAAGSSEGLRATGTAVLTVRPGAVADYTAQTIAIASTGAVIPFLSVSNTAEIHVEGGVFGGPGLGAPPTTPNNGSGAAFLVRDSGRLVLQNTQLYFNAIGIAVLGDGHLEARISELHPLVATNGAAIHLESNTAGAIPTIDLSNTTISGDASGQHLRYCVRTFEAGTSARVTLSSDVVELCQTGIYAASSTTLAVTSSTSIIRDNLQGGITCDGTCDLDLRGGSITNNAGDSTLTGFGGVFVGGALAHTVRMRGVQVTGNKSATSNVGTNRNDNSGLALHGGAAASYDLGTLADPGNNIFRDNVTGANTSNVFVATNAAVTVSAVGNTFEASVQGADAAGHYSGSVLATTGAGVNYRVSSGALLLSQ